MGVKRFEPALMWSVGIVIGTWIFWTLVWGHVTGESVLLSLLSASEIIRWLPEHWIRQDHGVMTVMTGATAGGWIGGLLVWLVQPGSDPFMQLMMAAMVGMSAGVFGGWRAP
ncbi:hypothetical protein Sulac_1306 [Sulfobacillus acidophilus DSM 10332]|uniref:Uncharacterized protein n=1 Tax=Sulfobacillus acidophilus (strain ATCC 700253 / DSM 10332 / NAL) TaxID=679936 RepID=G8TVV9_SULAD|nr:hypothetical protein Sulac_1306 [Sulfobacillus acidophilus DSM 10332]